MNVQPPFTRSGLASLLLGLAAFAPAPAQEPPITPRQVLAALARKPEGASAAALAERIRAAVGAQNLKAGTGNARLQETLILWALETDQPDPRVVEAGGTRSWPLTRLGQTRVWAAAETLPNFSALRYEYEAGGRRMGGSAVQVEYYPPHPDSLPKPDVPQGQVTQRAWRSQVFPGTVRDYWVYVPAQYAAERPAAVMVFQDGESYLNGPMKAATVLDNLIHQGEMPVTVGIFINPGVIPQGEGRQPRRNRSFEYDTLSDQYARFLRDEILPEVAKTVRLTDEPERRAICGASSGGICAFTAAWEMPDLFRKAVSHIGSFTNIASGPTLRAGGHNYPALIRKSEKKPLRVYLQDGSNDLDNVHGNWPLANQEMAAALRFKGYDYRFDYGQGFHNHKHGAALLPDTLRWVWRDVR